MLSSLKPALPVSRTSRRARLLRSLQCVVGSASAVRSAERERERERDGARAQAAVSERERKETGEVGFVIAMAIDGAAMAIDGAAIAIEGAWGSGSASVQAGLGEV